MICFSFFDPEAVDAIKTGFAFGFLLIFLGHLVAGVFAWWQYRKEVL